VGAAIPLQAAVTDPPVCTEVGVALSATADDAVAVTVNVPLLARRV
jgi:hypothetical protein